MRRSFFAPLLLVPVVATAGLAVAPAWAVPLSGGISGTVIDNDTGLPVEGVLVYSDNGVEGTGAGDETDASGRYTLTGLPPGEHLVAFDPYVVGPQYVMEYYDDSVSYEEATPVLVGSSVVTGIDAGLSTGGSITGTVTAAGAPRADVFVYAVSVDGAYRSGITAVDGTYEIPGLAAGSYEVTFDDDGDLSSQYFDGVVRYGDATPVTVTQGVETPDVDASLQPGGSISGTVVDAVDGSPLPDILVSSISPTTGATEYAFTDDLGEYVLRGVVPGETVVEFDDFDGRYFLEYYDDAAAFEDATPVSVVIGQTVPDVDATLDPDPLGRPSSYMAADPVRVLNPTAVAAKGTRTLTLTDVPQGATAVALNVTVSGVTANTYVSACPPEVAVSVCDDKSIINSRGPDTANFVVLKLGGPDGNQVRFSNNAGSVNLIADLQGYMVDDWLAGPAAAAAAVGGDVVPHQDLLTLAQARAASDVAGSAVAAAGLAAAVATGPASYRAADPVRVLNPTAVAAKGTRTLTLTDVPQGATAVALNVTVSGVTANTYVSACPPEVAVSVCDDKSIINSRGPDTANFVVLKLGGPDGNQVRFSNNAGSVNLIADLQGYMVGAIGCEAVEVMVGCAAPADGVQAAAPGVAGRYEAIDPVRVLNPTAVAAKGTRTLTLTDVPQGATAVALNVTVSGVTANTYVSACPPEVAVSVCDDKSIINSRGPDTANFVVLKLGGPDGNQVRFSNNAGSVNLIADLQGYMVGAIG